MKHSSKKIEIFILVASLSVLIFVLGLQFIFKVNPCELCHLQRWPYVFSVIFTFFAIIISKEKKNIYIILLILISLAFLVSLIFSIYHLGIEKKLWIGFSECSKSLLSTSKSLNELKTQLLKTPVIRCDETLWSIGGISLAGLNVLASIVLAIVSLGKLYIMMRNNNNF